METYEFLFALIGLFRENKIYSTTDFNYFSTHRLSDKFLDCTTYTKVYAKAKDLDSNFRL